jgi:hypothetical protein
VPKTLKKCKKKNPSSSRLGNVNENEKEKEKEKKKQTKHSRPLALKPARRSVGFISD